MENKSTPMRQNLICLKNHLQQRRWFFSPGKRWVCVLVLNRSGICAASCIVSLINDNKVMFAVRHYLTEDERDPYQEWLKKLRDPIAKMQVVKRVNRIEGGNFGDHKFCREGVWELRIDQGAGYRV